jgi:hypothetical protein
MSEERSWAEDTVVLGSRDPSEEAEPDRAAPTRRPRRRRPGRWRAAALIVGVGALVITVLALAGGDGQTNGGQAIVPMPEQTRPLERERGVPAARDIRRQVPRQAGALEIAKARRAPKPARSKTEPAQAPAQVEEEPAPVYEPTPEPVVEPEPAPEPSAAPAPETPAAVEFGM